MNPNQTNCDDQRNRSCGYPTELKFYDKQSK